MSSTRARQWIILCALLTAACTTCRAACTVSTTGLSYAPYDVFSSVNSDITGTVTIRCRPQAAAYSLSLSTGSGTYASRRMTNGIYNLSYNLFLDATRLSIWGNGSSGTGTVSGNGKDATHTVYGRVPALQNAHTGSYTDTIIVTITY